MLVVLCVSPLFRLKLSTTATLIRIGKKNSGIPTTLHAFCQTAR
jgi:hypothetical protein